MELANVENLKALISALAPGLIILGIRQRFIAGPEPSFQDRTLAYASVSALYYAVSSPLVEYLTELGRLEPWAIDAFQYVLAPALIGILAGVVISNDWVGSLLRHLRLAPVHHVPTAWDYAFSRLRGETYLLVTLSDGTQVAGFYGQQSFASSSNNERDLLIEDVWVVNKSKPWTRAAPAKSILLCGRDIRLVEFIRT
ncbi:DUF6338 family protein [Brevundimonas nasdae]|uniref:DUF6338 family protein n=1 Tax=Brevundimonas nasdae TaxID=172043 RepID=UPI003F68C096